MANDLSYFGPKPLICVNKGSNIEVSNYKNDLVILAPNFKFGPIEGLTYRSLGLGK